MEERQHALRPNSIRTPYRVVSESPPVPRQTSGASHTLYSHLHDSEEPSGLDPCTIICLSTVRLTPSSYICTPSSYSTKSSTRRFADRHSDVSGGRIEACGSNCPCGNDRREESKRAFPFSNFTTALGRIHRALIGLIPVGAGSRLFKCQRGRVMLFACHRRDG